MKIWKKKYIYIKGFYKALEPVKYETQMLYNTNSSASVWKNIIKLN